jgi:RNA polymerase sigma-70 factor (ECF subfamily)
MERIGMNSSLNGLDDKALFFRYVEGDEAAFRVFYERVAPKIWTFVKRKAPSQGIAEEIYQEAWTKIHRFRDRYDPALEPLPWVYTIARSVLIDRMRALNANPEVATDPETLEQRSDTARNDLGSSETSGENDLEEFLSELPPDQGELLRKRYLEDLSFEEIAAASGVREVTIRKRLSRILQKIRRSR